MFIYVFILDIATTAKDNVFSMFAIKYIELCVKIRGRDINCHAVCRARVLLQFRGVRHVGHHTLRAGVHTRTDVRVVGLVQ